MRMSRRNQNENINVNHYINVLQAYLIGEEIEHRIKGSKDAWTSCSTLTFDFNHIEYRVKPKPTHRPYIDGDEAYTDMQNHPQFGWLYNTIEMCYQQILCIDSNGISTYKENYSFEQAFKIFIYPNNLTFGVKLDEED